MDESPQKGRQVERTLISCYTCRHFYITYDPKFPYGCRAAGFKSRVMPSQEMINSSGLECQLFEKKEKG
ncbi:MAG: uracil-DNA glycosylase [Deltaproteobacteria bacterium]|nr:uracil-DNA glycosylase [Deltaproteobacteria bacterium]